MADISTEQDRQIKKLKRRLEGWRTVLLPIRDVLVWEEDWYPGITIGLVTLIFFIFWIWHPSVLTGFAAAGLIFNLIDYTVPIATHSLHPSTIWTGQHERRFEEICTMVVLCYHDFKKVISSFFRMRDSSPRLYHTSLICGLLLLAWIGSTINNLFLLFPQTYTRSIVHFMDSRKHR